MKTNEAKQLLLNVEREGMSKLVDALEKSGYFTAPASTRFHGDYEGGLVDHSYNLYVLFKDLVERFNLQDKISNDSMILCAMLHDVCKVGAYKNNGNGYFWNREQPKGHAILSIQRIEKYISLTELEKNIILYHMGMYQTIEFLGNEKGEYTLRELVNKFNTTLCKLFYFCDDMVSQFVDKRGSEINNARIQ